MIIKDAMVVIHLAKITLLEKSCEYFRSVVIPDRVHEEILGGKQRKYAEVGIILGLIEKRKIVVKKVKGGDDLRRLKEFNIQGGEAEVVALYWQEKAELLATDDDSVRKKSALLNIKVIGTPAIILKLYKEKLIREEKFEEGLSELRKIGWFSDAVIDKALMEGSKWGRQ